jgi:hypothetical protein
MNRVFTWPVRRGGDGESLTRRAPLAPVVAYVIAATVGGAATGAAIAALAHVVRSSGAIGSTLVTVIAIALVVIAAVEQYRGEMGPLPERRRQVPTRWLHWRSRSATAAAFGVMIGTGVLTFVDYAATYALGAIIAMSPSAAVGAGIGAIYGLSRGLVLFCTWICDRLVGRRPPWELLIRRPRPVSRGLAIATVVSPAGAMWLVL